MSGVALGFLFAFLCSFCWLIFDIARKKLSGNFGIIQLSTLMMYGQLPLFGCAMLWQGFYAPEPDYWQAFLWAAVLNTFGNVLFIGGVKYAAFSVAIPILSLTPVFTTLAGVIILGETLGAWQSAGVCLVFLGAFLLVIKSLSSTQTQQESANLKKGVAMMAFAALSWAVVPAFDKQALSYSTEAYHAFFQCLAIGLVLHLFLLSKGEKLFATSAKHWNIPVFVIGILGAVSALFIQFLALQLIEIGLVETIKRSTELFSAIFVGMLLFSEKFRWEKLFSVLLIGSGVALILLIT